MRNKQIKQELLKGKVISIFLAVFISLSAALCANAADLVYSLNKTMNQFFEKSQTAQLLQMHSGELDEEEIRDFANKQEQITNYEIVEMLNIAADELTIRQDGISEIGSVIDNAFVTQNNKFDFLLDSNNEVAQIESGYVGVPVYYQMLYDLSIGDKISLDLNGKRYSYTIADFIKDSQMNSSYISSKRFLLNEADWVALKKEIENTEYIIEFQMSAPYKTDELEVAYLKEGLPSNGPIITFPAIKLLNILTDVITAVVLILIAVFLVFISILCIRFAMVTSIDQEYIEIAVMKGLGLPAKYISSIYVRKYGIITLFGSVVGFIASFGLVGVIQKNLSLYMGMTAKTYINYMLQLAACLVIALLVMVFSKRAINKTKQVNVVEALQQKSKMNSDITIKHPGLKGNNRNKTNIILGIKYMLSYKKPYSIIACIFAILMMLELLPVLITTTIESENFSTYMGIAKCDLRIDFQNADNSMNEIASIKDILSSDERIDKFGEYDTYLAYSRNDENESVFLNFEAGDYTVFGVSCIQGHLPDKLNEISISCLLSDEIKKGIGDTIEIEISGKNYEYTICGIYQDITNGGKGAKVLSQTIDAPVYRSVINVNLKNKAQNEDVITIFGKECPNGKITNLENYITQTMSDSIQKFKMLSYIAIIITVVITVFSISIFMKLLLIKYKEDIATMKGLGFRSKDIRIQYLTRMIISLIVGTLIGEILVKTIGESIVSAVTASMGASKVVFVTNPALTYVVIPGVVLFVAVLSVLISGKMIKDIKFLEE